MKLLIAKIERVEDREQFALYDLAAHALATEALSAASAAGTVLNDQNVRAWIEAIADYPGITMRHINAEKTLLLGDRAEEIAKFLLKVRPASTS